MVRLSQEYPTLLVPICLSQGFYSCTNIMTKKQVGEERVYLAYTSILLFITKEVRCKSYDLAAVPVSFGTAATPAPHNSGHF